MATLELEEDARRALRLAVKQWRGGGAQAPKATGCAASTASSRHRDTATSSSSNGAQGNGGTSGGNIHSSIVNNANGLAGKNRRSSSSSAAAPTSIAQKVPVHNIHLELRRAERRQTEHEIAALALKESASSPVMRRKLDKLTMPTEATVHRANAVKESLSQLTHYKKSATGSLIPTSLQSSVSKSQRAKAVHSVHLGNAAAAGMLVTTPHSSAPSSHNVSVDIAVETTGGDRRCYRSSELTLDDEMRLLEARMRYLEEKKREEATRRQQRDKSYLEAYKTTAEPLPVYDGGVVKDPITNRKFVRLFSFRLHDVPHLTTSHRSIGEDISTIPSPLALMAKPSTESSGQQRSGASRASPRLRERSSGEDSRQRSRGSKGFDGVSPPSPVLAPPAATTDTSLNAIDLSATTTDNTPSGGLQSSSPGGRKLSFHSPCDDDNGADVPSPTKHLDDGGKVSNDNHEPCDAPNAHGDDEEEDASNVSPGRSGSPTVRWVERHAGHAAAGSRRGHERMGSDAESATQGSGQDESPIASILRTSRQPSTESPSRPTFPRLRGVADDLQPTLQTIDSVAAPLPHVESLKLMSPSMLSVQSDRVNDTMRESVSSFCDPMSLSYVLPPQVQVSQSPKSNRRKPSAVAFAKQEEVPNASALRVAQQQQPKAVGSILVLSSDTHSPTMTNEEDLPLPPSAAIRLSPQVLREQEERMSSQQSGRGTSGPAGAAGPASTAGGSAQVPSVKALLGRIAAFDEASASLPPISDAEWSEASRHVIPVEIEASFHLLNNVQKRQLVKRYATGALRKLER